MQKEKEESKSKSKSRSKKQKGVTLKKERERGPSRVSSLFSLAQGMQIAATKVSFSLATTHSSPDMKGRLMKGLLYNRQYLNIHQSLVYIVNEALAFSGAF